MKQIVIIGAGIVGLATAYKLLQKNPNLKVTVLEKEIGNAMHQTGNNSGVIHAGVYYKPGSQKAINCISGYKQLLGFCQQNNIEYDLCGKLIVASSKEEISRLHSLKDRAVANGLIEVKLVDKAQIKNYEPHATGEQALYVPYTGIVDYKTVANKYAELILNIGAQIKYESKVSCLIDKYQKIEVTTETDSCLADIVINTAGLQSDRVARLSMDKLDTRIIPFRGEYVELRPEARHLVKNLIYPVPDPKFPFLGVHFTRMIHGGIEAGPNAVWAFAREGYQKNDVVLNDIIGDLRWKGFRKVMARYWKIGLGEYWRSYNRYALVRALQKLVPEIQKDDLVVGGAGVRAQACHRTNGLADDFIIQQKGRIINVINAPSPAATASLAIGDAIAELALKK